MKQKQRYTPEFRSEAVKMLRDQGLSQEEGARRLGIPKGTLANWVGGGKSTKGKLEPGSQSAEELRAEVQRLRKELAEARLERDILKKATAYFARESLPGTRS